MARKFSPTVQFANFVCKFGSTDMLDGAADIVLPALLSGDRRRYGDSTYLLLNPSRVDLGKGVGALAFEFVKDTTIEAQQELVENKLVPSEDSLHTSPSAMVLLILNNHRMVYVQKTRSAPGFAAIATTCRKLINNQRLRYIRYASEAAGVGQKRRTRKALEARFPKATVNIIPIVDSSSIQAKLRRYERITALSFSIIQPNHEVDPDPLFNGWHEHQAKMKASRSRLSYHGEDLNKAEATREIEAAASFANGTFSVTGKGKSGEDLKIKSDDVMKRVAAEFTLNEQAAMNAAAMYKSYTTHIESEDSIPRDSKIVEAVRKVLGIFK